jgi:hypothetical protein
MAFQGPARMQGLSDTGTALRRMGHRLQGPQPLADKTILAILLPNRRTIQRSCVNSPSSGICMPQSHRSVIGSAIARQVPCQNAHALANLCLHSSKRCRIGDCEASTTPECPRTVNLLARSTPFRCRLCLLPSALLTSPRMYQYLFYFIDN